MKTIEVYCGTYGKYAAWSIDGKWLDLSDYADMEEFLKACAELHKDEHAPEFMFQDILNETNFPCSGEPGLDEIEKMIEFLQLDEHERELVEAYLEVMDDSVSIEEALREAEDHYSGQNDDFDDWSAEMAEECFCDIKDSLLWNYFDYEKWARDLSFDYTQASNGIIFHSYPPIPRKL